MSEQIKCRLEEKKKKSLDFSPWGPASNFRITWGQGLESGFGYPRTSTAAQNAECVSTFLGLLFFYYSLTERLVPECRRTWKRGWAPCTGKSRGSKSGPLLSLSFLSWPSPALSGRVPPCYFPPTVPDSGWHLGHVPAPGFSLQSCLQWEEARAGHTCSRATASLQSQLLVAAAVWGGVERLPVWSLFL